MKFVFALLAVVIFSCYSVPVSAQIAEVTVPTFFPPEKNLYIDVHQLKPGKVKFEDVAKAHQLDLAVEKKYGVEFLNFWVNEDKGLVYCLSASYDTHPSEKHMMKPMVCYRKIFTR